MMYKPHPDCQTLGIEFVYAGVFGYRETGTFVEVGAYDGVAYSNTVFLAELGWSGLYIEPNQELVNKCIANHKHRPKIQTIQALVGSGAPVEMRRQDQMLTGSAILATALNFTLTAGVYQSKPLDELLNAAGIPLGFDLLVVDVEGMEMEVFHSFDIRRWKPTLAVVETHEFHDNKALRLNQYQIDKYFAEVGYAKIYSSDINAIFLKTL